MSKNTRNYFFRLSWKINAQWHRTRLKEKADLLAKIIDLVTVSDKITISKVKERFSLDDERKDL